MIYIYIYIHMYNESRCIFYHIYMIYPPVDVAQRQPRNKHRRAAVEALRMTWGVPFTLPLWQFSIANLL